MEKCEYSELTIPNDPAYTLVAIAYVKQVAIQLGFDERDQAAIQTALTEAVGNVIKHAFEPHERSSFRISCERAPLGLRVVVKDMGLPADPTRLQECLYDADAPALSCRGISVIKDSVDEVEFHNKGPEGKEIVLVKYLKNRNITAYYDACNLEPYPVPRPERRPEEKIEFAVRETSPSEAVEVSRTVYRAYGYSYPFEHAYYPDRLVELMKSGQIYIATAVTPEGEIVGHCALIRKEESPAIAELGFGAVKPQFRSQRVFTRLTDHLILKAKSDGLTGVFGEAVTNHTFSQKTGHSMGLYDCALMVGYIPATVSFKEINEQLLNRDSVIVHFLYINKPERVTIYPPDRHKDMILKLYQNLGVTPEIVESSSYEPEPSEAFVTTTASRVRDSADIYIRRFGANIVPEVKDRLDDLRLKQINIIHLYMDLGDPGSQAYCKDFEDMGFFFSGILPGGRPGDALILQYLNNVAIDYDKINVESQTAQELLSYVRRARPS
jgi:anti-sigma regulatory factor (Ser/Thr protein kinase)